MIEVNNIEKSFGEQKVLKGITTKFDAGQTSLVIGQSGSGKTVFLIRIPMCSSERAEQEPFLTVN
jgi:ABC-type polar amino acid transport system ATPase subunit